MANVFLVSGKFKTVLCKTINYFQSFSSGILFPLNNNIRNCLFLTMTESVSIGWIWRNSFNPIIGSCQINIFIAFYLSIRFFLFWTNDTLAAYFNLTKRDQSELLFCKNMWNVCYMPYISHLKCSFSGATRDNWIQIHNILFILKRILLFYLWIYTHACI